MAELISDTLMREIARRAVWTHDGIRNVYLGGSLWAVSMFGGPWEIMRL